MRSAEWVAREHGAHVSVRTAIELRVVALGRRPLPVRVRCHSRPDDRGAIALAPALRPVPVAVEAVAEATRRPVREKRVLPVPALAVGGVERVDVDVAPVVVEGHASPCRAEAVDGQPAVRQRPVELVEAAVGPAEVDLEARQRSRPVREPQLPRPSSGAGGAAVVRQRPLPALHRPVRAVRRATRRYEPLDRRTGGDADVRTDP